MDATIAFTKNGETIWAKYSRAASAKVERAIKKRNAGTLKSGGSGAKVKSRAQAIAIGLSEARAEGKKVPPNPSRKRQTKKKPAKKAAKKATKKSRRKSSKA